MELPKWKWCGWLLSVPNAMQHRRRTPDIDLQHICLRVQRPCLKVERLDVARVIGEAVAVRSAGLHDKCRQPFAVGFSLNAHRPDDRPLFQSCLVLTVAQVAIARLRWAMSPQALQPANRPVTAQRLVGQRLDHAVGMLANSNLTGPGLLKM